MKGVIIINHNNKASRFDTEIELKPNLKKYANLFEKTRSGQPIWRIAIYLRLSKEDKDSMSIENQLKRNSRFLKSEMDNYVIHDIYIDDGRSGTDFDRKEYIRMENDIDYKFVNCIIFRDLTRYARNTADGIKKLEDFVFKTKVRFISIGYPFVDTYKNPKAISSKEVQDALAAAEDHARLTSQKVRETQEIYREEGKSTGGFPPYGFLINPDGGPWIIDPVASKILLMMAKLSNSGVSDRKITKRLNEMGIPNPTAHKKSLGLNYHHPKSRNNSGLWSETTVSRLLNDKNAIGYSVQGKTSSFDHIRHKQTPNPKEDYVEVQNAHPKIYDVDIYEGIQRNRKTRTRISKNGEIHPLATLLCCGQCNRGMNKNNRGDYKYFICRTRKNYGEKYCSAKNTIGYDKLMDIVLKSLQMQISMVADMKSLVNAINNHTNTRKESPRIEKLIELSKTEIAREEEYLDTCYYDWKKKTISEDQYKRIMQKQENKLNILRQNISYYYEQKLKIEQGITETDKYFEAFLKYKNIEVLDREIALALIEKVIVHPDKQIEIQFRYNDIYLMILDYINANKIDNNLLKKKK